MPPIDLETLLCGGGDRKIACETQISAYATADPEADNPDLPPESVQLPIREYLLWAKLNKVLDRGESTIGSANPKSSRSSSNPKSGSQRFAAGGAMKLNGPIIGLAGKIQPFGSPNSAARPPKILQIFPGKISLDGGRRKPVVPEPGSPKVSCFGSVLSERDNENFCQRPDAASEGEEKVPRCWPSLAAILRYGGGYPAVAGEIGSGNGERKGFQEEKMSPAAAVSEATAPEFQGMKRSSSERRPASWLGDVDVAIDGQMLSLEPLDRESAVGV